MTQNVLNEFNSNVKRILDLHSLYCILRKNTEEILDISDILRAEMVLIISALDCYMHNLIKEKMIEVFKGNIPETDSFKKFKIPLEEVKNALDNPKNLFWLENEIYNQHNWKSFQQSKKIEDSIALISSKRLWYEVGLILKDNPEQIKAKLDLIVDRRNKIAHEADIDPSFPGQMIRWPIDEIMVKGVIDFIENIIFSINHIIDTP